MIDDGCGESLLIYPPSSIYNPISIVMKKGVSNVIKVKTKKGQSTLEYVLVIAVIIAAVAIAAGQFLRPAVNTTVQQAGNYMIGAANKLVIP